MSGVAQFFVGNAVRRLEPAAQRIAAALEHPGAPADVAHDLRLLVSDIRSTTSDVHGLGTQHLLADFNQGSKLWAQGERVSKALQESARGLEAGTADVADALRGAQGGIDDLLASARGIVAV
jgi:hypothetical protein